MLLMSIAAANVNVPFFFMSNGGIFLNQCKVTYFGYNGKMNVVSGNFLMIFHLLTKILSSHARISLCRDLMSRTTNQIQ